MAVNLETNFCGISFKNPIIIPAGVHGRDGDVMKEVSSSGVAGICTKPIVSQPSVDVLPCFSAVQGGMLNSVFGSDKTSEYWFGEGIKKAKEGSSLVLANLAGFTPEEAGSLAAKAEEAGADMIMLDNLDAQCLAGFADTVSQSLGVGGFIVDDEDSFGA